MHKSGSLALARAGGIKPARAARIAGEVDAAVERWPAFAGEAGVAAGTAERIAGTHRRLATLTG